MTEARWKNNANIPFICHGPNQDLSIDLADGRFKKSCYFRKLREAAEIKWSTLIKNINLAPGLGWILGHTFTIIRHKMHFIRCKNVNAKKI